VTFDGSDYRLAWYDLGSGRRRVSQRVSPQGVLASDPVLVVSSLSASVPKQRGAIAAEMNG
jgi:hypothetical protein